MTTGELKKIACEETTKFMNNLEQGIKLLEFSL